MIFIAAIGADNGALCLDSLGMNDVNDQTVNRRG